MDNVTGSAALGPQLFPNTTPAIDHYVFSLVDSAGVKAADIVVKASDLTPGQSSVPLSWTGIADGGSATITGGQYDANNNLIGTLVSQTVNTPPGTISLNVVQSISATASPA